MDKNINNSDSDLNTTNNNIEIEERVSAHTEKTDEHHHHRNHHSHRHSKSKRRSKKSFKEKVKSAFGKKYSKILNIVVISALVISVLVFFIVQNINLRKKIDALTELNQQYKDEVNSYVPENNNLSIELPIFGEEVLLINNPTEQLIKLNPDADAVAYLDAYKDEYGRLDEGLSVVINLDILHGSNYENKYISGVEISSDSAMFRTRTFKVKPEDKTLAVKYLETGKEYQCALILSTGERLTTSFKTADSPRVLSVDGLVNVRDIGGWKTIDGKRIKQGLLYRGSEIDGAVELSYKITTAGRDDMLTVLGIKYDLDLRADTDHTDEPYPFGAVVSHKYYDSPMYEGIFNEDAKIKIGNIFKDIANPANYPMYLHCTYGLDRTGSVCYLLEALLGVPQESLLTDYKLSALFHGRLTVSGIMNIYEGLNLNYHGDTLSEKTENYLLECGLTKEEIESIKSIFLVAEVDYN